MSHTAGFEDRHVEMVTWEEEEMYPPREWLVSHVPGRVFPPGEVAAYSNYGAALAGYIVARVSGQSYSQYVQEHILDPLGMAGSTAEWPTPPDLAPHESVGYLDQDGKLEEFPRLLGQWDLFPAGAIRATATDMARFMIAHLQDGVYGDGATEGRILNKTTAEQMHGTLYSPDPRLLGSAYGFFDFSDNGQRTIGHGGEAEPMQSLLLLLLDQNMGVFVAYNSSGAEPLTRQHLGFQRAFFDHYYSTPALEPVQTPIGFSERAEQFVGVYRMTRNAYTTLEKYLSLMMPTVSVENPGDDTLLLRTPYGDWRIIEEDSLHFRQADAPLHFAFRTDSRGRIAYLFTDYTPMMAFEKVPWYETIDFNLPLLVTCLLVFLSVLPVTLLHWVRSRRRGKAEPAGARAAYWLIIGIALLNLLFTLGNIIWGEQIVFGISSAYKVVLAMGVVSANLTAVTAVYVVLVWKNKYWGVPFRTYYTLVTTVAMAFVWFLNQWNLLGWRY